VIANVKLGIQGWHHPEWVGRAYPTNISSSEWLVQYSRRFSTVELDDTFYGLPAEPVVRRWRDSVQPGFSFAPKLPQQITHEQRFATGGALLGRFLDRISLLGENLGPILLVAPLGFQPEAENRAILCRFVEQLPADFRWALELKHEAWYTHEIQDVLAKRNVATVTGESRWIRRTSMLKLLEQPCADFAFLRWNGPIEVKPQSGQPESAETVTAVWKEPLARLCELVSSVYGYFHVRALGDGLRSAKDLQYSIDELRLKTSVSADQESR
jgi:uncharacterized protein YecE (DUF72 family)